MDTQRPPPVTHFIGRAEEVRDITALLTNPSCRLLTLVGPGGVGKTRLAIEATAAIGKHFNDGVHFVALQAVTAPESIVYAIADALNVGLYERETPANQLLQYLGRRQMLLILDNFEHLLEGARFLTTLLEQASQVKLLVTSREVVNIQSEHIYEVGGLAVPTDARQANIQSYDAIRLFTSRAGQTRHDFTLSPHLEAVIRICRLVGGMPLGIELAAAWIRTLTPAEIAAEIEGSVDFLSTNRRDVPARHQSIRAVFDHSWRLMQDDEQGVFRRLAVFYGAFNREGLVAVTGASLNMITALVNQSLIRVDGDGHYTLHEMLRQYAREKLLENPDENEATLEKHSTHYLGLLARLDHKIKGREQVAALDIIEAELDNIRAAWEYAVVHQRGDLILPAFECLILYYQMRCRLAEGYEAFSMAVERYGQQDEIYAWLSLGLCWFAGFNTYLDNDAIAQLGDQALALLQTGGRRGMGTMMVMSMWRSSLPEVVYRIVDENLAACRASGDLWGQAWSLEQKGSYARHNGDLVTGQNLLAECIGVFERLGDAWSATWPQALMGLIAEDQGRFSDAFRLYMTRLNTCQAVGDAGGVAWSLQQIAKVSLSLKDLDNARYYCRESLRVALDISSGNSVNEAILRIISMYIQMGKHERAAKLCAVLVNQVDKTTYAGRRVEQQLSHLKSALSPDVFNRALLAAAGLSVQEVGWALLDELADEPRSYTLGARASEALSERELEVLRLAAEGLSNQEIADQLVVTLGTVKKHLNNIYSKLGVGRRTEAIAHGRRAGILP